MANFCPVLKNLSIQSLNVMLSVPAAHLSLVIPRSHAESDVNAIWTKKKRIACFYRRVSFPQRTCNARGGVVSVGIVGHRARFEKEVVLSMVVNQQGAFCFF